MNLENWTSVTKGLVITDVKYDEKEKIITVFFNAINYKCLFKNKNTIKRLQKLKYNEYKKC